MITQLNRVELRGVVGAVRRVDVGGHQSVQFTIATNYVYKGKDGMAVIETTWHNVTAFAGEGISEEDISKLEVRSKVYVCGRLRRQRYTGTDGSDRYTCDVLANRLELLDQKEEMRLQE